MVDTGFDDGSLADLAYGAIRQAILRCDLAPGQYVTEAQLSTQFGAGRAAVRAALARLGHERLVRAIPRKGHQIAPITFQQVRDLFGVRLIVEPAAARLAAERADEQILGDLAIARIFGIGFVIQGLLFLYTGTITGKLSFGFSNKPVPWMGIVFVLYGMIIYPLLGLAFGHLYPAAPVFGVAPCPTVIFTFGILLLAVSGVPLHLIIIPLLWSIIGMGAALSLRVPQDYGLVLAGIIGTVLVIISNRKGTKVNYKDRNLT